MARWNYKEAETLRKWKIEKFLEREKNRAEEARVALKDGPTKGENNLTPKAIAASDSFLASIWISSNE